MANTVIRIKRFAFCFCPSLIFIKLSINVEVIEHGAFYECNLSSVFIPPRCREIGHASFENNDNLSLFHVHSNVQLDKNAIDGTKLIEEYHFELDERDDYNFIRGQTEEVVAWIKNINNDEKYSLHRACSSYQPLKEIIHTIIQQQGLRSFTIKNEMGITPSRYLKENPFADLTEQDIIRDYIMRMMGEYE